MKSFSRVNGAWMLAIPSMRTKRTPLSLMAAASFAMLVAVSATVGIGQASDPGITEVDQKFTERSAGTADRPIMSATTVGGVFLVATLEEYCGTMSLRLLGDPDRVLTVNGGQIPPEGFPLVVSHAPTLFNTGTMSCSTLNPAFTTPQLELAASWAAGATQLPSGNTRIAIGFAGTLPPPAGSPVLLYMVLEVEALTKNVSITTPLRNTGLPADGVNLASDGTWIASFFPTGPPRRPGRTASCGSPTSLTGHTGIQAS